LPYGPKNTASKTNYQVHSDVTNKNNSPVGYTVTGCARDVDREPR